MINDYEYQPVIIIGAPRSGTNMLRDLILKFDTTVSWPCDEINYIWRHGNVAHLSDEFCSNMAREEVIAFIQNEFRKIVKSSNRNLVIEKTCANSLRIEFINKIFPNAKFIFIVRNGFDAAYSANIKWNSKYDLAYLYKKLRFVPKKDYPFYLMKLFRGLVSPNSNQFSFHRRALRGPVTVELLNLVGSCTALELCAYQWKHCVEASLKALGSMEANRFIQVKYEDLVNDAIVECERILDFLQLKASKNNIGSAVEFVRPNSVGVAGRELNENEYTLIQNIIQRTNDAVGFS